jgi:hypothetical protein
MVIPFDDVFDSNLGDSAPLDRLRHVAVGMAVR